MIKILFAIAFSATYCLAAASGAPADTVKVIKKVTGVVVTRSGASTMVTATYPDKDGNREIYCYEVNVGDSVSSVSGDDDWGFDLPFMKRPAKIDIPDGKHRVIRDVTVLRHIYWGWRFNYDHKVKVKNCFELGIRDVIGVSWKRRGAELEIGLGFGMQRLLAEDGFCYEKEGDFLYLTKTPADLKVEQSRLDIWRFHIPVFYNQDMGKGVAFTLGATLSFNSYARAYSNFKLNGVRYKAKYKNLQQNLFSVETIAALHYSGVGVYGSWNPSRIFKKGYGPETKAFSIGVDLDF